MIFALCVFRPGQARYERDPDIADMMGQVTQCSVEFLIIGLKQQLAKFYNCPNKTTHSTRNLVIIFDEHLTFSDQISSVSSIFVSNLFLF